MPEPHNSRRVPTNPQELWFNEPVDDATYFDHDFGGYSLEGRIAYNQAGDEPWVLSIHGSRADYTKTDAITLGLRRRGMSVLAMNLSGHSQASGVELGATSLRANIHEAAAFYQYLDPSRPKVVIGYSIGGTPALKLLERHADDIATLVLCYPGVYSQKSYDKPYGPAFRDVISQPFSYRDNDTVALFSRFKGRVVLVKGEYDGLDPVRFGQPAGTSAGTVVVDGQEYYSPIPAEVFDMLQSAMHLDRAAMIEIPNCGHSVALWMRAHPQEAQPYLERLAALLHNGDV